MWEMQKKKKKAPNKTNNKFNIHGITKLEINLTRGIFKFGPVSS